VKARYSYALLFLLPNAMMAFLAGVILAAAGAGVLWIFVYGDSPWPESANTALMTAAVATSASLLAALVALSYRFGKNQETKGGLRRSHALVAVSVSILLPLLVLLHQWQVGNIGSNSLPANNSYMDSLQSTRS
jgi:RsiW-degrading membrane proteinase PrsW (M82 family)